MAATFVAWWTLCQVPMLNIDKCLKVTLPMNIHESLFAEGLIPDLFDTSSTEWVGLSDWTLSGTLHSEIPDETNLHAVGISTHAEIFINEQFIGNVSNAFIDASFFVQNIAFPANITIFLKSPIRVANNLQSIDAQIPVCPASEQEGFCGVQQLRIPQYLFGWDWGPATASISVRSVALLPRNACNPKFLIRTILLDDDFSWKVEVIFLNFPGANRTVTLLDSQNTIIYTAVSDQEIFSFTTQNVKAWFPRGYGDQAIYTLRVAQRECDSESLFGFREVKKIVIGSSWHLRFNNKANVYLKGVNIVPSSAFRDSSDYEVLQILNSVEALGLNTIRQWGGGWYGSSLLYEEGTKRGIIVWEEIKLACATYPINNSDWRDSLEREIKENLLRIRNYPSFAILSGNNEVEIMLSQNWFAVPEADLSLYRARYKYLETAVREAVEKYNSGHAIFLSSSPEKGTDVHFYDYRNDCGDWRIYPETESLVSEFGFQSWAFLTSTPSPYIDWRQSETISRRNHRANGNMEMWNQSVRLFPDLVNGRKISVNEFIWTTQMMQATCVKAASESFRRQKNNSGIMIWQLNDVWETASWSLIDFNSLRKPAFFSFQESMKDGLISLFRDDDDLVAVSLQPSEPLTIFVVDLFSDKVIEKLTEGSKKAKQEIFRVQIGEICISNIQCVAAVSPTNFILLGPVSRPLKYFPNPKLEKLSDSKMKVSVTVPTPFLYIHCNVWPNFLFLSPGLWESIALDVRDCPRAPDITHMWSFLTDSVDPVTSFEVSFI